jgi:hypothetical protein
MEQIFILLNGNKYYIVEWEQIFMGTKINYLIAWNKYLFC